MHYHNGDRLKVAVIQWVERDEIAEAISRALSELGYRPKCFHVGSTIPSDSDMVFSFAPYGRFLPLVQQLERLPKQERPLLTHWNTEGVPDLRIPWVFTRAIAGVRSWLDRMHHKAEAHLRFRSAQGPLLPMLESRMLRFRYVGDYYYAFGRGILNLLSDSSAIYAKMHSSRGLPTLYAPWGASPIWYDQLDLERDIDVLWMGTRGSARRSLLLKRVRNELERHGVNIHMADNVENPFIFRRERTVFLNRAKITLNITRTWYDDNFSRFALAIPNRSLIISEQMLPHCPAYKPGVHYVAVAPEELAQAILYYLEHPAERERIVESAYRLTTSSLTFKNSINAIMQEAERVRAAQARA